MPARRELHTGRLNFLHAPWCPLEPFDDSMPELLRESGVHTHLCTDHYHYIQDGGATYHGRYSTYEVFRGQECDRWIGDCSPIESLSPHVLCGPHLPESYCAVRKTIGAQNDANRTMQRTKADYPQTLTFDAGLAFLERNAAQDNWFLQIEAFDPHEPFDAPSEFFDPDRIGPADWPPYAPVHETEKQIADMRAHYLALLRYCDENLGARARCDGCARHVARHDADRQHRPRLPARRARLVGKERHARLQRDRPYAALSL